MTVEVASRAGPGERRSRCAEETATVPREVAASQATLDALLCELLLARGAGTGLPVADRPRKTGRDRGFIEEALANVHPPGSSRMSCSAPGSGRAADRAFSALRIACAKAREPDILLLRDRSTRVTRTALAGPDLVVEVVSPDHPERDLVEKRADYAEAGIPEYWIADPRDETLTAGAARGDIRRARSLRAGETPISGCSKASRRNVGGVRRPGDGQA